jgi:hypothetical protein
MSPKPSRQAPGDLTPPGSRTEKADFRAVGAFKPWGLWEKIWV